MELVGYFISILLMTATDEWRHEVVYELLLDLQASYQQRPRPTGMSEEDPENMEFFDILSRWLASRTITLT